MSGSARAPQHCGHACLLTGQGWGRVGPHLGVSGLGDPGFSEVQTFLNTGKCGRVTGLTLGEGRAVPGGWLCSCGVSADLPGCDLSGPPGNAAVVLRSRLKVKVVKELRGEKGPVSNGLGENGPRPAHLDVEVGKQVMQYQVRGHAPCGPQACPPCLTASGRGAQGRRTLVGPQGGAPPSSEPSREPRSRAVCQADPAGGRCPAPLSVWWPRRPPRS